MDYRQELDQHTGLATNRKGVTMQKIIEAVAFTLGTVLLFVLGISVFLVRQYLPLIGIIVLICLTVLIVIGSGLALALGTNFTLRQLTRFDFRDIGEFGTIAYRFKHMREYTPYAPRIVEGTLKSTNQLALATPVDKLSDVLEKGLISPGSEKFLLGMYSDNTPCYTVWDKVKSIIVAGMSGSGKSVTMVWILVQLMLSKAARLTVIDPHWSKIDGLTNRLKPLSEFGTFVKGNNDEAIQEAVREFREMLEGRINGDSIDEARILVIDEWNRIASRNKDVFDDVKWIVEEIAQEGRGYLVYVMLAGQIWMPSKSGGTSIIDSMQSAYVHRIKTKQARYIVDADIARQTEKMLPGHVFFSNADGESEQLIIPECKFRDSVTIRDMLKNTVPLVATSQNYNPHQLTSHKEQIAFPVTSPLEPETNGFIHAETNGFIDYQAQLRLPSPGEINRYSSRDQKKAEIARLKGLGLLNQSQIIYHIWRAKPGETQGYKEALAEYKSLLDEIVRSA